MPSVHGLMSWRASQRKGRNFLQILSGLLVLDNRYLLPKSTVRLHWLVATGMTCNIMLGSYMVWRSSAAISFYQVSAHAIIGMAVLILGVFSVYVRVTRGALPSLGQELSVDRFVSVMINWILLGLTIVMPLSGLVILASNNGELGLGGAMILHSMGKTLFVFSFFLHLAVSLKQEYVDDDGILRRMLGHDIRAVQLKKRASN